MVEPSNSTTDPIGQNLIKLISNVCFSVFVFSALILTVIAISYKPPDPWESSRALTRVFTQVVNATFQTDSSVLKTGEDMSGIAESPSASAITEAVIEKSEMQANSSSFRTAGCEDLSRVNCSDPRLLFAIEKFNLRVFKSITFLDYQTPVNGTNPSECDVAWRYRNKKEKSWRKYRDFRRFRIGYGENCTYKILNAKGWHSGVNARRPRPIRFRPNATRGSDDNINDTIPVLSSESAFRKGKYLYYSRGGDYCKGMNHFQWSFLCALGEAQYLNRTFVMDLSICLASTYTSSNKDEEGKDFRFYFDFEHLKDVASITEEGDFIRDWRKWDKTHKKKIPVRKVSGYKATPMQLLKDKSTIIWRHFDGPEPENYWYRVCEGPAGKYIQRPWHSLWKSKRLTNVVSAISGSMDWDFDGVHVVRGEKAMNKEKWPHLDSDTSPEAIVSKLEGIIQPWRNVYVATNEPYYNYFDKLRSHYKVHLLDDYKELWGNTSEWYNETRILNGGKPVEFDGYMRVEVDTEVLYRAKTRVETFYNLTSDCKDGVNTC
ncbi:uncharacterized protein LOC124924088 [Impatiens glandulifera]|uniref:uncharacterized protein LOC124924088 n=1 Tax=Impatiens glandulifera TaxID=253017 RepID=UPI001FB0F309|nr:uncharacterized protein LOC124924088 [Impatiens glandulifera]